MAIRIAYVLKRFPRLSETFILEEMLGLEERGFELSVYAIADPKEAIIDGDVKKLKAPVTYLSTGDRTRFDFGTLLLEHIKLLSESPRRYITAVRSFPMGKSKGAWLRNVAYGIRLARLLDQFDVDHVHGAFIHSPSSVALIGAKLCNKTFSLAGHAKDIVQCGEVSLQRKIERANFVLLCSAKARREVALKAGLSASQVDSKLKLLRHGVDLEKFRSTVIADDDLDLDSGGATEIVTVGRLVAKKGYGDLIDALAIVAAMGRLFTLRMVGDGPLRKDLEEKVALLGLRKHVTFLGAQDRSGVIAELERGSLFVHPSVLLPNGDSDGIPNVVLEAMAFGKVVVGADIDGIKEAIDDGVSGRIYRSGDVKALAQLLIELIDDRGGLVALSKGARAKVEKEFSKEKANDCVAELMASVLPSNTIPVVEVVKG